MDDVSFLRFRIASNNITEPSISIETFGIGISSSMIKLSHTLSLRAVISAILKEQYTGSAADTSYTVGVGIVRATLSDDENEFLL